MVFDNGKREGERGDVDIFVSKVDSGVSLDIAKKVHRLIEVRDRVCLITDEVIESICAVGVDKAIAHPFSGPDAGHSQ